ncbi:hypothetical protein [Myxococcus sp. RHSTA-1-4]|uniref:hypothetical protein n=1 Tax=Myxococcus sp. RHSTA-1-4 TaxID=2874601 RepID=UPI001CBECD0E|nr:hypothetical protein [Myxococcus sp. RHSTA-1-4]MBZ4415751.1 hypothetical protein [Myxococcus sp. RHSTA-1-4]
MIRTRIFRVRRERDDALLEAMLLAAQVREPIADDALRVLLAPLLDEPELQGERPEVLLERLRHCARRLSQASDEDIFSSLRGRLPDPRNRLLAYGLAMKAASSDDKQLDLAARFLARLQVELGVTSSQVKEMVLQLAGGASPFKAAAEPPAHLHQRVLEMVLLAVGLEATLTEAEVAALAGSQEDEVRFRELVDQQLRRLAFGSEAELPALSVPRQLEALALAPASATHRREAWLLAARFSLAIGRDLTLELLLDLMGELLGVDDEFADPSPSGA